LLHSCDAQRVWLVYSRNLVPGLGDALRLETNSANPAAIAAFRRQGFREYGSLPLPPGTPPQWHGGSAEALFQMDLA
jgi:RimJ/RimL family protein N-acetyltransferase